MRRKLSFIIFLFINISLFCSAQNDSTKHSNADTIQVNFTDNKFIRPDANSDSLNEALLNACEQGSIDRVVSLLLKGANVDTKTEEGVTPLMFAAQNGFLDIVQILIFNGADVNLMPRDGATALIAATRFNHDEVMDTLIHHGAYIDIKTTDGASALTYACAYGYYIPADMLLFYGADPNQKARNGITPLMVATANGNTDIVKLLLAKKTATEIADTNGWTALHYAIADTGRLEVQRLLIDSGANINAVTKDQHTPLALAAEYDNIAGANELLKHRASAENITLDGYTPYHIALEYNHKGFLKMWRSSGQKTERKPSFNLITVSPLSIMFNRRDFKFDYNVSLRELNTKFSINAGFSTRLWSNRVLVPVTYFVYYQFWERRSSVYLGIGKLFDLAKSSRLQGIYADINYLYTYGRYRGSTTKPNDRFLPSFGVGYIINGKEFGAKAGLTYTDYKIDDFPVLYYTGSIFFCIHRKSYTKASRKPIDWL